MMPSSGDVAPDGYYSGYFKSRVDKKPVDKVTQAPSDHKDFYEELPFDECASTVTEVTDYSEFDGEDSDTASTVSDLIKFSEDESEIAESPSLDNIVIKDPTPKKSAKKRPSKKNKKPKKIFKKKSYIPIEGGDSDMGMNILELLETLSSSHESVKTRTCPKDEKKTYKNNLNLWLMRYHRCTFESAEEALEMLDYGWRPLVGRRISDTYGTNSKKKKSGSYIYWFTSVINCADKLYKIDVPHVEDFYITYKIQTGVSTTRLVKQSLWLLFFYDMAIL